MQISPIHQEEVQTLLINKSIVDWLSFFNLEHINQHGNSYFCVSSGLPDALFNMIALPSINNPALIEEMTDAFKQKALPYSWWIEEKKITPAITKHFSDENYTCFGDVPGMIFDLQDYQGFDAPKEFQIKPITTVEELKKWAHIIALSFGFSNGAEQYYVEKLAPLLGHQNKFVAFGAYKENKMVSTGSIVMSGDVGGFYNMATLETYRGQGLCKAMHHARLNYLKNQGAKIAVVQTTPMATSSAIKVGFRQVVNYKIYLKT